MNERVQGILIGVSFSLVLFLSGTILSGIVFNQLDEYREISGFEYRELIEEVRLSDDNMSKDLLKQLYYNDNKIDKMEAKTIMSTYYLGKL